MKRYFLTKYDGTTCGSDAVTVTVANITDILINDNFHLMYSFVEPFGYDAHLWSSSEFGGNAWRRTLVYSGTQVNRNTPVKAYGFSVRCLKD